MIGTKYLSELVDCSEFQKGKLNIIKAPTGSGKSYFALQHIPSLVEDAIHKVVYLIDTTNGKEQLLKNDNAAAENNAWAKDVAKDGIWFYPDNRVVIITYAKFGWLLGRYPDFHKHFSYIICDEIHNLLKFQHFSPQPNVHSIARRGLEDAVNQKTATVIALTATPSSIAAGFKAPVVEIAVNQEELIQYEVNEVVGYTSLDTILFDVDVGTTGLCYLSRITQMKAFEEQARKVGFSPVCIWSINNPEHRMSDEQLAVRKSVLEDAEIPAEYDLLIINSSCETSLKIKSPVDYVIVNSSNPDTQIQVRGRVNSDLKKLYLPTNGTPSVSVPEEYLAKKLFTEEKNNLCATLNLRNANNRLFGWTTVKGILIDNDYSITEGRSHNRHYVIILPSGGVRDDEK